MTSDSNKANPERGTSWSYVVGFVLSLVFTFIPYNLVVNQTVTGTVLLATILGFAFLQMLVQIIFFLHIGRGPKPRWNLYFFVSTFGLILVVVGGSIFIINNLHYNMPPSEQTKKLLNDENIYQIGGEKTGVCNGQYQNHQVRIKDSVVEPLYTEAKKCDTLSFINEDGQFREISFGTHPEHDSYAGENDILIRNGKSKTITLSETGAFEFHDHLQPEGNGYFIVTEQ